MEKRTCVIPDCGAQRKGHDLCNKHLIRLRRHGDPLCLHPNATRVCQIAGCERPHHARGWCVLHWNRWHSTGDPLAIRQRGTSALTGADNPRWSGDGIGYSGVHLRMWRADPASGHPCAHCQRAAENWAYDHADPNERQSPRGPFSLSAEHYIPLCYSCHTKFDKGREQARA